MTRSMCDPGYVYRPWSEARRQAAITAAETRIYGSPVKARSVRKRKLRVLLKRRAKLTLELSVVRANIAHLKKHLT